MEIKLYGLFSKGINYRLLIKMGETLYFLDYGRLTKVRKWEPVQWAKRGLVISEYNINLKDVRTVDKVFPDMVK